MVGGRLARKIGVLASTVDRSGLRSGIATLAGRSGIATLAGRSNLAGRVNRSSTAASLAASVAAAIAMVSPQPLLLQDPLVGDRGMTRGFELAAHAAKVVAHSAEQAAFLGAQPVSQVATGP